MNKYHQSDPKIVMSDGLQPYQTVVSAGVMGSVMGVVTGMSTVLSNDQALLMTTGLLVTLLMLALFGAGLGMMAASLVAGLLAIALHQTAYTAAVRKKKGERKTPRVLSLKNNSRITNNDEAEDELELDSGNIPGHTEWHWGI